MSSPSVLPIIDAGWAGAALADDESGDQQLVVLLPEGALLALVDGLGHGPEAALAAREAVSILEAHAAAPVLELVMLCHEGLRKTRGAVMTVASIDARSGTMDWCGVGNVEGLLFRARRLPGRGTEAVPTRGGVVGYRLPQLRVNTLELLPGDLLVLATDGIQSGFSEAVDPENEPQSVADAVLARCGRGTDDALVLVARYRGWVA